MSRGFWFQNNIDCLLLLNSFFHADSIDHQFKVPQDLWRLLAHKGLHSRIGQQLGKVTLGEDQIQEV